MQYAVPVAFAVLVWWISTGAILYLVGLPRQTYKTSMAWATVLVGLALVGVASTSEDKSVAGAYLAFTLSVGVWGWHEMSFLTGMVTGPRTEPIDPEAGGFRRFASATATLIYHEIAIALTVPVLAALTAEGPNRTALWTFVVLWIARLSTKLNIYLGVANLTEAFLPGHLDYLKTYFRKRPMNGLFPFTVTLATVAVAVLAHRAAQSDDPASIAAHTLVATMAGLAVLEHWLLVLPIRAERLWEWGMRSRERTATPLQTLDDDVGSADTETRIALVG